MASPGACAVPTHIDNCLVWLHRNMSNKLYATPAGLALDYGRRGTRRFFPLSIFLEYMKADERFDQFMSLSTTKGAA